MADCERDMTKESTKMILDSIQVLRDEVNSRINKLQTDMDILNNDFKVEMQSVKESIQEIEKSLESAWGRLDESSERHVAHEQKIKVLQAEVESLHSSLEAEKSKSLALESYTRRENLRLMNLPESEDENLRPIIRDIIGQHLYLSTAHMRFYAIHRVGRKPQNANSQGAKPRPRPIIIRFLCREDRDDVFREKGKLKESQNEVFRGCYFTADYPTAIRKERGILVRAMLKAQAQGKSAKVVHTTLYIDGRKYTATNIPEELRES